MSGLFDDPNTISVDRRELALLQEEVKTIAACVASANERLLSVQAQINAMLGEVVPTRTAAKKDHVPKLLLTRFDQEFQRRFGRPAPINGAKDAAIMKRLAAQRPVQEVEELIVSFFNSEDEFICSGSYTVGFFSSMLGKLIAQAATPAKVVGVSRQTRDNGQHARAGAELIRHTFTR